MQDTTTSAKKRQPNMTSMTVFETLNSRLPKRYVLAVIANITEKVILDEESSGSILDEMEEIFDWSASREGYEFWATLYTSMASGKKLPELPFTANWEPDTYLSTLCGPHVKNWNGTSRTMALDIGVGSVSSRTGKRFLLEKHLAFCN